MKIIICVVVATLVGVVGSVEAQNAAQAEQLFREAKALFDAGKTEEACKTWEASERLDPSLGTLTNIANCREKNGDLATAWEAFVSLERRTAGIGKYASLNTLGKTRAAALEPRLSYLTINVPDEVRVDGLEVLRGGVVIDTGAWNRALPIDGGTHTITGRAPGHEAWSTTVTVAPEGDRKAVEVPRFKAIRNPQGGGKTLIIDRTTPSPFTPRRKIAVGVAAGGVVALAAGAFLGFRARGLDDDAQTICPQNGECTLPEVAAAEAKSADAHRTALYADVAFGVGIAAVATGAVLWLKGAPVVATGDDEEEEEGVSFTPTITPSYAGVTAGVRF
jgi:hypothetical protein